MIHVEHNGQPVTNWLLTAAGRVYLLSYLGSDCEFEDVADTGEGYLDGLDVYPAPPEVADAVRAAVSQQVRGMI